ncbi:unnamed protein product [Haemonchus placei]|uniref:Secreted protein n=1 Tax=Haemonchus placei TaxID=6290 RepID=A0A0N4X6B0_HAEPC|nr:unnamed protein product [Haemonchus placei]
MAFLFVLLFAATISGKSLNHPKGNVDLSSDAQKPASRGALLDEAEDDYWAGGTNIFIGEEGEVLRQKAEVLSMNTRSAGLNCCMSLRSTKTKQGSVEKRKVEEKFEKLTP